jgi:gamma-glutamyltranspeptidase / glutathione hydrolase
MPDGVRKEFRPGMGSDLRFAPRASGPVNASFPAHGRGTLPGGSGNHGEDYGISW